MGYGGPAEAPIGAPWTSFYAPGAAEHRDATGNPADPPQVVVRSVNGGPATAAAEQSIVDAGDFAVMRRRLELLHNAMHTFVNMGGTHISFRDPFVFLLHSNCDRIYARWQTQPGHPDRLVPATVYGTESA